MTGSSTACSSSPARRSTSTSLPPNPSVELWNLSENATYRIEDAPPAAIGRLRVHREGYHSKNAIASELAWLMDLRATRVVVTPLPVRDATASSSRSCPIRQMKVPRNVVLFEWEEGAEPGIGEDLDAARLKFSATSPRACTCIPGHGGGRGVSKG